MYSSNGEKKIRETIKVVIELRKHSFKNEVRSDQYLSKETAKAHKYEQKTSFMRDSTNIECLDMQGHTQEVKIVLYKS